MINKFSILRGAKYFSSEIFQNYLVFIPPKIMLNILLTLLGLICGNLVECQKKILRIWLNDTEILHFRTLVDHHVLPDVNFNGHFRK